MVYDSWKVGDYIEVTASIRCICIEERNVSKLEVLDIDIQLEGDPSNVRIGADCPSDVVLCENTSLEGVEATLKVTGKYGAVFSTVGTAISDIRGVIRFPAFFVTEEMRSFYLNAIGGTNVGFFGVTVSVPGSSDVFDNIDIAPAIDLLSSFPLDNEVSAAVGETVQFIMNTDINADSFNLYDDGLLVLTAPGGKSATFDYVSETPGYHDIVAQVVYGSSRIQENWLLEVISPVVFNIITPDVDTIAVLLGKSQEFSVQMNTPSKVTWYLNDLLQVEETEAIISSFNYDATSRGIFEIRADAEAEGATITKLWKVNVIEVPTPEATELNLLPLAIIGGGLFLIASKEGKKNK